MQAPSRAAIDAFCVAEAGRLRSEGLNIRGIAKLLGLLQSTLHHHFQEGRIPGWPPGGTSALAVGEAAEVLDNAVRNGRDAEAPMGMAAHDVAGRVAASVGGMAEVQTRFEAASDGAALLVRSSRSAQRQVVLEGGRKADLWEHLAGQSRLATQTLELAACGGKRTHKLRTAHRAYRHPRHRSEAGAAAGLPPVRMLAVSATETPNRKNALHWLLLTTEGLAGASAESRPEAEAAGAGNLVETAKTAIRWYVLRWTIELFFKALKTGTRIKDRRLDHADDLRKCLVFDAITACHVFDLERMARDKPDTPAGEVVSQEEIDDLYALLKAQGGARARANGIRIPAGNSCD